MPDKKNKENIKPPPPAPEPVDEDVEDEEEYTYEEVEVEDEEVEDEELEEDDKKSKGEEKVQPVAAKAIEPKPPATKKDSSNVKPKPDKKVSETVDTKPVEMKRFPVRQEPIDPDVSEYIRKGEEMRKARKDEIDRQKEYVKPKPKKIVIPFVIPWEAQSAKQSQHGMGAFRAGRDAVVNVVSSKPLPESARQSETIIPMAAGTNQYASQKGASSFGAYRKNVGKAVGGKDIDKEKLKQSETMIPFQSGSVHPSQSGQTPIGSIRQQVMRVQYRADMADSADRESQTFIGKLLSANPNNHAGTNVIDTFRRQVVQVQEKQAKPPGGGPPVKAKKKKRFDKYGLEQDKNRDRRNESVLPRFYELQRQKHPKGTGAGVTGLGPFRQVVTNVTGGYELSYEDNVASKKVVPWATAPSLESQAGTGGFSKVRDVVSHTEYDW